MLTDPALANMTPENLLEYLAFHAAAVNHITAELSRRAKERAEKVCMKLPDNFAELFSEHIRSNLAWNYSSGDFAGNVGKPKGEPAQ